jgi:hypothetical protein
MCQLCVCRLPFASFATHSRPTVCVCVAPCGYAPSGYWWAGRDNAALPEPAPSHANCLKTRTAKRPTITTLVQFAGGRVHALLARFQFIAKFASGGSSSLFAIVLCLFSNSCKFLPVGTPIRSAARKGSAIPIDKSSNKSRYSTSCQNPNE